MSGRDSGSASSSASGSDSDRASGSDNGQRGRVDRNGDPLPFFEFPTHPFFDLTYPKEERDYRFSFNYDEEAQARLDAINIFGEFELGFPTSANGWLLACWAFGVVFALMGAASQRLYAVGARALDTGLNAGQVATLVASSVLLLYVGAYRCVHLSWAPVTARRCLIMPSGLGCKHFFHSALMVIIAPLFACGFVYAPPRRLLIANGLAIIAALGSVGLRHVPSPWNEVVHAALALVLAASCVSFAFVFGRACHSGLLPLDVDALAAGKQEKDARQERYERLIHQAEHNRVFLDDTDDSNNHSPELAGSPEQEQSPRGNGSSSSYRPPTPPREVQAAAQGSMTPLAPTHDSALAIN